MLETWSTIAPVKGVVANIGHSANMMAALAFFHGMAAHMERPWKYVSREKLQWDKILGETKENWELFSSNILEAGRLEAEAWVRKDETMLDLLETWASVQTPQIKAENGKIQQASKKGKWVLLKGMSPKGS